MSIDDAVTVAPVRQRPAGEPAPSVAAAWTDYLAAARQLDGVRRGAATAAAAQSRAVEAARAELTGVRARLAPQQARLRELGVPAISLAPTPPELTEAARAMVGGPAAVLAGLRRAQSWAEGADAALAARGAPRPAAWPPRWRNLLVYGPLALVVPVVQLVLFLTAGAGPVSVVALLVGLPMPAVAFAAGRVGVSRLFPPGPDGRWDHTPRLGLLTCLVPAVVVAAGIMLALLAG
ncbi:hypothetical protein GA0070216_109149 [Micromonospora matsumotoense]|uniref:Uncharacterized protein n=1 Tax=Micromonospora matsumotoense TaxID=121616 RepID=A0A1C4ZEU6_9ACTN|nr:hypothetical protein GA0070216_109149 [Micromonospora matsumotoense]